MFSLRRAHIAILILVERFSCSSPLIWFAFVLVLANTPNSQHYFLPSDEREGEYLLQNGLIDPLIWSYLAPLYSTPASVPDGELVLLEPIMDENLKSIEYQLYEPWENRNIRQFFNDFPFLEPFRPVLCFNRQPKKTNGQMGLNFSKPLRDREVSQLIRFRYRTDPMFEADGRVVLKETNARWRSRSMTLSLPVMGAQAGNIRQPFPGRVFYGYFQPQQVPDDSAGLTGNWLYPQSNAWNGLGLSLNRKGLCEGALFYHQRYEEKIYGGGVSVDAKEITVFAGLSRFYTAEDTGTIYLHLFSTVSFLSALNFELETGVDVNAPKQLPFVFRSAHRVRGHRIDLEGYYFPEGLELPQSRLKRTLLRKGGVVDIQESQVHGVRLRASHILGPGIRFSPEFELVRADNMPLNVHSSVAISINRVLGTHLRYSSTFEPLKTDALYHRTFLSLSWAPHPVLDLRFSQRYNHSPINGYRYSFRFEVSVIKRDALGLTPFIRGYSSFYGDDLLVGFKQQLTLSNRTRTVFSVEKSIQERGWDNVLIRGSSHYLF